MIRLLRPYLFSCVSLSCLSLQVLMRSRVTAHTGPDTRTKTHDVMGDQGRMVTIRDDGYHSHCMMYSIRPKIPGLPRAVVGRHC